MPDDFNANTAGTASPAPNDVGAASAGGDGATGQQTVDNATATAAAATPEEFSAGWSYEDQPEQQSAIPDGDDDLQGMTADPNLDQAKVPGLVEAIKGARAEARQARTELKQFR